MIGVLLVLRPTSLRTLLKIAVLGYAELIVRPERVVEGEVPVLFGVIQVQEPRCVALHLHAQPAIQLHLAVVEGADAHAHFDTHTD